MANESDLLITPLSGLNHIDALLDIGPDWNFMTPGGNTILYTFSTAAGTEPGEVGFQTFNPNQQAGARGAFAYLAQVTGIQFLETNDGDSAQVHLAGQNLAGSGTTGLTSWTTSYAIDPRNGALESYSVDAWIYLDNVEWAARSNNLTPGTEGYETLLHELGHMLGLKHPFEDSVRLPAAQDNTGNTLLSYNDSGTYPAFRPYDIAALNWLYGGDGLGGALGINSPGNARYLTGTGQADTLAGGSGNDRLQGEGGIDTAVYQGARAGFSVQASSGGFTVNGSAGVDTLAGVERIQFSDINVGLDLDGSGGQAYRVYRAAFDRVPDSGGLGYWIKQMDNGLALTAVAQNFIHSAEFTALYGADLSDATLVARMYNNVLHRAPDQAGLAYWLGAMDAGLTRADVLSYFSDSPENRAQVIGEIGNGFAYTPWLA